MAIDRAGNNLRSASQLGVLPSRVQKIDFIGGRDSNDYYKFHFRQRSRLDLTLNGFRTRVDIDLFNGQGRRIAFSRRGGAQPERILRNLNAGAYYIRVHSRDRRTTRYTLNLFSRPFNFIRVIHPNGRNPIKGGSYTRLSWRDNIRESVRIGLYQRNRLVQWIQPFQGDAGDCLRSFAVET